MGAEGRMSTKRFVAMRKDESGNWQAASAHKTQLAAQQSAGKHGGVVDTQASWYKAWLPYGATSGAYMPDDVRLAFEARAF